VSLLRSTDSKIDLLSSTASSGFSLRSSRSAGREYARWLGRVEGKAILPMKWGMLAMCLLYWLWVRDWALPTTAAFMLFFIYAATTAAEHYLFAADRVTLAQVRPLVFVSYALDLMFITLVIYLDTREPPLDMATVAPGSDFYILYLLLILRGFALFRTAAENTIVAGLISILFVISLLWTGQDLVALGSKAVVLRLALIWAIMLLATFIVSIVSRQQEEVLRVRERLVKSEGLAALGELAAGVAHEINNPIGIIKTYAEYLRRAAGEESPHHEDYEIIQKEAERCEKIVRRLLDFANPNVREVTEFDPKALIEEVVAFVFHEKAKGKVSARVEFEGRIPAIRGDAGQIKQALLNVLINARQILSKMEKPGEVLIRLRQLPGPRAPIEITVHDNGPGISPEDAERAFEPFFTRRDGGTGLGLAITRRIIEAHDGTIEIWPAANEGTSCAITLPISTEEE
jgi:signal transduction histidine kinase